LHKFGSDLFRILPVCMSAMWHFTNLQCDYNALGKGLIEQFRVEQNRTDTE
jgi:hypothetical protein